VEGLLPRSKLLLFYKLLKSVLYRCGWTESASKLGLLRRRYINSLNDRMNKWCGVFQTSISTVVCRQTTKSFITATAKRTLCCRSNSCQTSVSSCCSSDYVLLAFEASDMMDLCPISFLFMFFCKLVLKSASVCFLWFWFSAIWTDVGIDIVGIDYRSSCQL